MSLLSEIAGGSSHVVAHGRSSHNAIYSIHWAGQNVCVPFPPAVSNDVGDDASAVARRVKTREKESRKPIRVDRSS